MGSLLSADVGCGRVSPSGSVAAYFSSSLLAAAGISSVLIAENNSRDWQQRDLQKVTS